MVWSKTHWYSHKVNLQHSVLICRNHMLSLYWLCICICCSSQVNLIHVASTCKNAADEKLRQSIRRFADIHGSPAAIIVISGDINFAADLNDLRHRYRTISLSNRQFIYNVINVCPSWNWFAFPTVSGW